jgi:hypothetical protein
MTRTRGFYAAAIVACISLGFTGCLEHEVKTTIHADGSCDRSITLTTSSRHVPDTPFPLMIGSAWDTSWTHSEGRRSDYLFTAKKHFVHFEELAQDYREKQPGKIDITIAIQKKFRWFYTYFTYDESYGQFTMFTLVPPGTVMTDEEIERYTYGDTSEALKNKRDEWVARNVFEMIHRSLIAGARALGDSTLLASMSEPRKAQLFRTVTGLTQPGQKMLEVDKNPALASYKDVKDFFEGDSIKESSVNALVKLLADNYGAPSVGNLRDSLKSSWRRIREQVIAHESNGEKFNNSIVMPGMLLATNAKKVEGAAGGWEFGIDQLSLHAYEMHAESRVVNLWAIWVTGAAGLVIVALLLLPVIRRSRPARV